MSTWSVPITWVNGAVSAASMNTLRDNLLFLKGALDLLTASTTADTGTTTYLDVRRTNSTDPALRTGVSGAANPEFQIGRDGKHSWGAGGGSALDITFSRLDPNQLIIGGTSDPRLLVNFAAVPGATRSFVAGQVTGDAAPRIAMRVRTDGGGQLDISDGTTVKGTVAYSAASDAIVLAGQGDSVVVYNGVTPPGVAILNGGTTVLSVTNTGAVPKMTLGDASIRNVSTKKLEMVDRFSVGGTGDGLVLKTKSGAVTDADFAIAGESGLTALDTGGFLYIREGSTWRFIETRGELVVIGPFTWTNLAQGQTNLEADFAGITSGAFARYPTPYAGDIVGLSVRGSANWTAGTATFKGLINTSATTLSTTIDTSNVNFNTSTQSTGVDPFIATDRLGMQVTSSAGFTPTGSTEYAGWLHCMVRRR